MSFDISFYKGKRVLLTGHTGFKGSWMTVMLVNAGAEVIGYSSCTKTEVRLFDICGIKEQITHVKGDVRNLKRLLEVFRTYQPEIVIHMAGYSHIIHMETFFLNIFRQSILYHFQIRCRPSVRIIHVENLVAPLFL